MTNELRESQITGRMGGVKAAKKLTPKQRKERAQRAALGRWGKTEIKASAEYHHLGSGSGVGAHQTKRTEPRAGSKNARLLQAMREPHNTERGACTASFWAACADLTLKETSRALVALRAMGHVVSEGPRHAMLWRLAP